MSSTSTVKIKKKSKGVDLEKLKAKSKEELISEIVSLHAHNEQLKNIIAKGQHRGKRPYSNAKQFDFETATFRHVLLRFYYLGWDYNGYTAQEDTINTVEYHLFQALTKTCLIKSRETSNYHRCGRTDKGVSSFSQVISIDLRTKLTNADEREGEIDYCKLLNKVLPDNIQCIAWCPVPNEYSARFDCNGRTYKYFFPKGNLDIENLRTAAEFLVGVHDFRNLCKMDVGNGVTNFFRSIMKIEIEPLDNYNVINELSMFVLTIKGKAFLWHQIRCIMGALFLVGSGKESPLIIKELLDVEKNPRKPDYNLASEIPLNLYECEFELNSEWIYDNSNLIYVINKLKTGWTHDMVKSAMAQSMIADLIKVYYKGDNEDIGDSTQILVMGVKAKNYIPLFERHKCGSLEDKIEHYVKRKRIELNPNENP